MSFFSLQIAIIFKSVELQMLLKLKLFVPQKRDRVWAYCLNLARLLLIVIVYPTFGFIIYIRILVFFNRDVPPPL